jgi:predicted metal-binding protein
MQGEIMTINDKMEEKFVQLGFNDFKWIDPKDIVFSQWVRMKCVFGCPNYGKIASCPPQTPSVSECERFFREYTKSVIFHFNKVFEQPEDRIAWGKKINLDLIKLEREVFLSGYVKAFLLPITNCEICKECTKERELCKHPELSRPTPEGMAVDVFSTVRKVGYPIEVLIDFSEEVNRYAILLVE